MEEKIHALEFVEEVFPAVLIAAHDGLPRLKPAALRCDQSSRTSLMEISLQEP